MTTLFRILLVFIVLTTKLWATPISSPWYSLDSSGKPILNVELYLSSTCPYCHQEDAFFHSLEPQYPWLHVQRHFINDDKQALLQFSQQLNSQNSMNFEVPAAFFCDSMWTGFDKPETTGKDILHALNYCKQEIEKKGGLNASGISALRHLANFNFIESGINTPSPAYYYTLVMVAIDAFNPCAFFSFLGFLAFLFLQKERKAQISIGVIYLAAVGISHYFQQAHITAFYQLLPWLRWTAVLAGLLAFYLAGRLYRKESTHNLLLPLAFVLGFLIQSYQQTCVWNWSLLFEQWIHNQGLSSVGVALYSTLYQFMYLLTPILLLVIYVYFINRPRFEGFKKWASHVGLVILMLNAAFLIVYPVGLSSLGISLLILLALCIYAFYIRRRVIKSGSK